MDVASFTSIGIVLRRVLAETVGDAAHTLPIWRDGDPDTANLLVLQSLHPGRVIGAECGGPEALAVLTGLFSITVSYPASSAGMENAAWSLAQTLTRALYRKTLSTAEGCALYTGEPYTTNAGRTPDGRLALAIAVPWRTWTRGYIQEEN